MKKIYSFFILLGLVLTVHAQDTTKNQRVLYVVDNVAIINDPDQNDGSISQDDVDELKVVTNKAKIEQLGYHDADKVILITTKEYKKRPDDLKKIPTTKVMERKDGCWYTKGDDKPYSGPFIDYFYNGKKQGEGILKNGKVDGLRVTYNANGNKSFFTNYTDGIKNGDSESYFPDGKLKQKGRFKGGLDDGLWVEYYSIGAIKRQVTFVNTKPQFDKSEEKFYALNDKAKELMKGEDYKSAIRKLTEAIEIKADYSDTWFYRGTAKLDNLDFDGAIADFDKAIILEPLYMEAFSNRAFARIRKYQFKNSRTLSNSNGVTIMAGKDHIDIPKEEKEKICSDLNNGNMLGDRKSMTVDAIKEFCQ